ncbi:MAG: glycosyltransferase family 1 protein [bacterium]
MKRILIDGRFIGVGDSMTRYCLEFLQGVLAMDNENSYTLLIRPIGEEKLELYPDIINAPNLSVDILDIPHYSLAEQTKLLKYLNREKYDLVHFIQFNHPVFYKGNYVVTIHDLTLIGHLHYKNILKQISFKLVMRSAIKDSCKVIAVSKTSRDDIIDFFGDYKKKIEIIYLGIDRKNYHEKVKNDHAKIEVFKAKYGIMGDYLLYTGMWKKHKNLVRLFKAYEQFFSSQQPVVSSPIQLVLTGKVDQNEPEVIAEMERVNQSLHSKFKIQNAILSTGFIDEAELPLAYAGATLYATPSLSEGFGWPPLEAMAVGTPVIASNLSCMPEILGDAPYYFDPYNIEEISGAITKVVSDEKLREELIQKGLKQVQKYDWNITAKKTLEVYKKCLKS